jgi:hypothetical protein
VDLGLEQNDIPTGERARTHASDLALRSTTWGAAAGGDAILRIGATVGTPHVNRPIARPVYRIALFRAPHERPLEGVIRVTEALVRLGNNDMFRGAWL